MHSREPLWRISTGMGGIMKARRRTPRGARGWLKTRQPYRARIVNEIRKRSDYRISTHARATRIMMAGRTPTDAFREALLERMPGSCAADEDQMREQLRLMILSLAPSDPAPDMTAAYQELKRGIKEVTRSIPPVQIRFRRAVNDEFKKLLDAFEATGPFHRPTRERRPGRDRDLSDMPLRQGGAGAKYWLDFTATDGDGEPENGRRVRLRREAYPANETFSIWEDFTSTEWAEAGGLLTGAPGEPPRLDTNRTAIDAFDQLLEDHPETLGRFCWVGELLSVTHFWCVPAEDVLRDLPSNTLSEAAELLRRSPAARTEATDQLFESIARFADRTFPHTDPTLRHEVRRDHVITVIGDGEAVLVADFLAHSRDADLNERAVRYAIVNLSAQPDKLGRLLMRLHDIEAYRIVALRDYQFTFPVTDVIDACNAHIARAESEAARSYRTRTERRRQMKRLLDVIMDLSARITAANHFIEGGLVGLADRALEQQQLIQTRLNDLNEHPVLGYQSLSGYIRKVDNSIASMQRSRARYERARHRIDEIVNLARAEIDQVETESAQFRAGVALILTIPLIGIEVLSAFTQVPSTGPEPNGSLVFYALLATAVLILAGVLDELIARARAQIAQTARAASRAARRVWTARRGDREDGS